MIVVFDEMVVGDSNPHSLPYETTILQLLVVATHLRFL